MALDLARLQTLFNDAMTLDDAAARAVLLDQACAGDPEARAAVDRLLVAHEKAGDFMTLAASPAAAERPGARIGPYHLLTPLGEGGFGVVFLAQQERPIKRRVALKVIKLGMDTRQVIARFEAERQALALMDHPNIARVLDAGATDAGRPYFVMDLIEGARITDYCDGQKLSIPRRLELFVQVCHAVQHAHQKGLIHRDLKPSNVLVTTREGRPVAKVIDFGISKAIGMPLTEKTLFTEQRQWIGTPEYMSPEQAEGNPDIDTRSDVYALGVLLYELLAGAPPFDPRSLRSQAFGEIQRIIREVEPPAPSARLSTMGKDELPTVAARRGTEPQRLGALLRGEPDWIVMKALEKDRARRYQTAGDLADDVLRHLAGEPVIAAAPSRVYRLRKFVRRNRLAVIASAAVVVTLAGGVIGTTIGLVGQVKLRQQAEHNEREARQQAAIARAVARFQVDLFASADPQFGIGDRVTVLESMRRAARDMGALKDQPLVESGVLNMIGSTLRALGHDDEALPLLRRALELRRANLPPRHPDIAWTLNDLAGVLRDQHHLDEAEPMLREALSIRREALPANDPKIATSLSNLGLLLKDKSNFVEAERMLRDSLDVDRNAASAPKDQVAGLINLGLLMASKGDLDGAEPLLRQAKDLAEARLPKEDPVTSKAYHALASFLHDRHDYVNAEPLYRRALKIDQALLPAGHPNIAAAQSNLGLMLRDAGKWEDAEILLREALATLQPAGSSSPPEHPEIAAAAAHNLALMLLDESRLDDAERFARQALRTIASVEASDGPHVAIVKSTLAAVYTAQRKPSEAEVLLREAVPALEAALGAGHARVGDTRLKLGGVLAQLDRPADAEAQLLEAERVLATAADAPAGTHRACVEALVALYTNWEKREPGKGYDARASHWKNALSNEPASAASRPTAAPTTRP